MTMTTEVSDVGECGQWATSGTAQDMSNDVSWAIGVFLLLFFITNYNIQVLLMFKGPVRSGFSAWFRRTATETGCLLWQDPKKPVQTSPDHFFLQFRHKL